MIAWQIIHGIFTALLLVCLITVALSMDRHEIQLAQTNAALTNQANLNEAQIKFNDEALRLMRDIVRVVKQK